MEADSFFRAGVYSLLSGPFRALWSREDNERLPRSGTLPLLDRFRFWRGKLRAIVPQAFEMFVQIF